MESSWRQKIYHSHTFSKMLENNSDNQQKSTGILLKLKWPARFGDENFKIVVETWILFSYGNFHRRFRIWAQNWHKVCNLTLERLFGHLSDESSQKCQKWTKWRSRVKLKNKLSILRSCSKSWMKITQWKKFMSLRLFWNFTPLTVKA